MLHRLAFRGRGDEAHTDTRTAAAAATDVDDDDDDGCRINTSSACLRTRVKADADDGDKSMTVRAVELPTIASSFEFARTDTPELPEYPLLHRSSLREPTRRPGNTHTNRGPIRHVERCPHQPHSRRRKVESTAQERTTKANQSGPTLPEYPCFIVRVCADRTA